MLKYILLSLVLLLTPLSSLQAQEIGMPTLVVAVCIEEEDALVAASKAANDGNEAIMQYFNEPDNSCILLPQPFEVVITRVVRIVSGKFNSLQVVEVMNASGAKAFAFKKLVDA